MQTDDLSSRQDEYDPEEEDEEQEQQQRFSQQDTQEQEEETVPIRNAHNELDYKHVEQNEEEDDMQPVKKRKKKSNGQHVTKKTLQSSQQQISEEEDDDDVTVISESLTSTSKRKRGQVRTTKNRRQCPSPSPSPSPSPTPTPPPAAAAPPPPLPRSTTTNGHSRAPQPINNRPPISLQRFVDEDSKRLLELQEQQRLQHEADERKQREDPEEQFVIWGASVRPEPKIKFIQSIQMLNRESSPELIAKYLITLEQLNAFENLTSVLWTMFNGEEGRNYEYYIRCNLAFCAMLSQRQLTNTPFVEITQAEYTRRVFRLQHLHKENIKTFQQLVAVGVARAVGRPLMKIYEPPIDQDDQQNGGGGGGHDEIKQEDWQKLLDFMFQKAGQQQVRRSDKAVYAPRYTPEGHNTRCYVYIADLDTWIRQQVTPESAHTFQYNVLTKKMGTCDYIALHLGKQPDARFPFLIRCRTLFSFRNGIYNASDNKFYLYATPATPLTDNIKTVYELDEDVSTAQYFHYIADPAWFEEGFDYKKIETPMTESIFVSQNYKPDELDWVEALSGRLQHDVGELDDWQTALHFEGPAKTGKSVYLKLLALWYLHNDIGLIGDDVQQKFSSESYIHKFIVMCMDISRELGLTPSVFLSWCSGDWLMVNRKYLEAIAVKWKAPSVWASNGKPPIVTNGGAGPRRFTIAQLLHAITHSNAHLLDEASKESGAYCIKCSMSYHDKVTRFGSKGLWDDRTILPAIFWTAKSEFTSASSWPDAYLGSGRFEFAESKETIDNFTCSLNKFKTDYSYFVERHEKLEGVNRWSPPKKVSCTQIEFANALKDASAFPCRWDEEKKRIFGLRLKDADTLAIMNDSKQAEKAQQQYRQQTFSNNTPQTSTTTTTAAVVTSTTTAAAPFEARTNTLQLPSSSHDPTASESTTSGSSRI